MLVFRLSCFWLIIHPAHVYTRSSLPGFYFQIPKCSRGSAVVVECKVSPPESIDDLWQQVGVEFLSRSLPPQVRVGGPVWQEERNTTPRRREGGGADTKRESERVEKEESVSRRKREGAGRERQSWHRYFCSFQQLRVSGPRMMMMKMVKMWRRNRTCDIAATHGLNV